MTEGRLADEGKIRGGKYVDGGKDLVMKDRFGHGEKNSRRIYWCI